MCCDQRIIYGSVHGIPKKNEHKYSAAVMHPNHLPSSASVPAGAHTMQKVTVSLSSWLQANMILFLILLRVLDSRQ